MSLILKRLLLSVLYKQNQSDLVCFEFLFTIKTFYKINGGIKIYYIQMPLLIGFGAIDTLVGLQRSMTHGSSRGECVHTADEDGTKSAREISTLQASIQT